MELNKIDDKVYYIDNPVNIGVIRNGEEAILIDTGLDKRTGKKILSKLEQNGLYPRVIINTHAHADHCGANAFINKKTGAKIYAAEIEKAFIENTSLEPFCFFAGAEPINDLKTKFLQAVPTKVDKVIKSTAKLSVQGMELTIVPLPGHSLNHIGIAYDGVLFCGDAIFSKHILDKHQVPFCINIEKQRKTLTYLSKGSYRYYLPAHGKLTEKEDIKNLANYHRQYINDIEEFILNTISTAKTTESILQEVAHQFSYKVRGAYQYYLLKTSIMAYLSYLYNNNKIKYDIKKSLLYWRKL